MMNSKKKLALVISILFMTSMGASALQGYVIESGPSEFENMVYNWGVSDTNKYYQDGIAYGADLGLMVCDDAGGTPADKWVGLNYYMNGQNSEVTQLTSYSSSGTLARADISTSFQGNNCKRTGFAPMTVSPSVIPGTPTTKIAAFPADVYVQTTNNQDGSNSQFLETNSIYDGSYSGSASYTYSSNQISTNLNSISVNSDIGTRSFSPGASGRGITNERPMIVGVCSDQDGQNCETGVDKLTSTGFPLSYTFDEPKSSVNDQVVYTRYAVANGINFERLDIGANLRASDVSVSKDPIYYSQTQEVSFTITNDGNVPVTSTFDVTATISGPNGEVRSQDFTVSGGLSENGGVYTNSFEWEALAESGNYNVNLQVDTNDDITETSEGDNSRGTSFELKPITLPDIYVDGEKVPKTQDTFPDPGVPYNFSVKMKNSDNVTLSNSTVLLEETDGLSSFSPTQEIDNNTVTETRNTVSFETDSNGTASLTVIPTGNVLLADKYSNLDIQDDLDYSLELSGSQQDGTEFKFINSGTLQNYYPLSVSEPGQYDGSGTSDLPNLDNYVKMSMNGVYSLFAEFWGAVT